MTIRRMSVIAAEHLRTVAISNTIRRREALSGVQAFSSYPPRLDNIRNEMPEGLSPLLVQVNSPVSIKASRPRRRNSNSHLGTNRSDQVCCRRSEHNNQQRASTYTEQMSGEHKAHTTARQHQRSALHASLIRCAASSSVDCGLAKLTRI